MAISSPQIFTDDYHEHYTFFVDGTAVKFTTYFDGDDYRIAHDLPPLGRPTPVTAFVQPVADSPIAAGTWRTGRIRVTYLDASGARLEKWSDLDGIPGSWMPLDE